MASHQMAQDFETSLIRESRTVLACIPAARRRAGSHGTFGGGKGRLRKRDRTGREIRS